MRLLKQIFDFYLDASIHVSLAVVSLYLVSLEILKVSTNYSLVAFLFFGTIVCYNFIKYGVEAKKYLIVSNPYHKWIQILSFVAFVLSFYFFLNLDKNLWIAITILVLFSALYAIPFLPQAKNLRSLGGMKIYLVALVWIGCTAVLPVVDDGMVFNLDILILMLQQLVLVLILLIPFEIRDLGYDEPTLKTLPQRIGVRRTKFLAFFLIAGYMLLPVLKSGFDTAEVITSVLFGIILVPAIVLTKKKQSRYFASFWIEALPILYLGIWILVKSNG